MNARDQKQTDLSDSYLKAKQEVDNLCRKIVSGGVTPEKALEHYHRIERQFAVEESADQGFFRLIYKSRVQRLSNQFLQRESG